MSTMIAMATPILPGKEEVFQEWMRKWKTDFNTEFLDKHNEFRIHERVFLQRTPQGEMTVVVIEGDDVNGYMKYLTSSSDHYCTLMAEMLKEVHGMEVKDFDLNAIPKLMFDTEPHLEAH